MKLRVFFTFCSITIFSRPETSPTQECHQANLSSTSNSTSTLLQLYFGLEVSAKFLYRLVLCKHIILICLVPSTSKNPLPSSSISSGIYPGSFVAKLAQGRNHPANSGHLILHVVSHFARNADSYLRYPNTCHSTRQPLTVSAASQCGIMAFLTNLPNELLVQIFCSLGDIDDALHFGRTCTAINRILESPEFYLLIMRSIIVSGLSKDQSLIHSRTTRFHQTHIVSIFDYAIF